MPERHPAQRVVMFTLDRQIDRRILLEADALEADGWRVQIVAMPLGGEGRGADEDPRVVRVVPAAQASRARDSLVVRLHRRLRRYLPPNGRLMKTLRTTAWWVLARDPAPFFIGVFREAIETLAAEVYVGHDLPMLPVALEAARRHGGRVVYDSHELYAEQEFSGVERRMWRRAEERHIRSADEVITVNASIADELQRRYRLERVHVVHNADFVPDQLPEREPVFQRHFGLPEDARIVLFQGGLSEGRNLDTLVRAMEYVADTRVHLVMLGDGVLRGALACLVRRAGLDGRVHFHAAVPQKVLLRYTAAADVGVIPYRPICLNNRYATPNKLFEFVAAGLPVVASDLPELRRFVCGHGLGLVGDTASPAGLGALLGRMFAEADILERYRKQVRVARQSISWQNESRVLVEAYRALRN